MYKRQGHLIRADGSPRMTMLCNLLGAVINTVLDAVFVLGLDWKMTGAAWATVIGQVISGTVAIVYLTRYKTVHLGLKHLRIRWQYTGKSIAIGMASCINQLAMMIVQIVMNLSLIHIVSGGEPSSIKRISLCAAVSLFP